MLKDVLKWVQSEKTDTKGEEPRKLLEILLITDITQEPIYSLVVAQNIRGIREKCLTLLDQYGQGSVPTRHRLYDHEKKERDIGIWGMA